MGRSLRARVPALEAAAVRVQLAALAERRVRELLGLARRSGVLTVGIDALSRLCYGQSPQAPHGWVCIVATDLAERSRRKVDAQAFLSSRELGHAVGMGAVGALGIAPGRLAKQAAYWLRVWYETRDVGQAASKVEQSSNALSGETD